MPQLINADNGECLLKNLEIADTFWTRFKGLQFRRCLPNYSGLLLSPCSSLHTCFMKFPIDVVMLDIHRTVLGIRRGVSPWRIVLCEPGTTQVIEVNPGTVEVETNTRLDWGDKEIGNR